VPNKSQDEWNAQQERLIWRLAAKDGLTYEEAVLRIIERTIRLGTSLTNRKFWRIIKTMMSRRGLSFPVAASRVWGRASFFLIRKGLRRVKEMLGEE